MLNNEVEIANELEYVNTNWNLEIEPNNLGVSISIEPKITKERNWVKYTEAQVNEHEMFDTLLIELLKCIPEYEQKGKGRPRHPIRKMILCAVRKVYSGLSFRRAQGLLEDVIGDVPIFSNISNFLNKKENTPILQQLIRLSASPLVGIENDFAVDSTGFTTTSFGNYNCIKHKTNRRHEFMKLHICTGVKTNIITDAKITGGFAGDSPQFKGLVNNTAENFNIEEISADKAYSSRDNLSLVGNLRGTPYIPFKSNAKGRAKGSAMWHKMYYKFQLNREEFDKHYHKMSNVESTFGAIKQKFGESLKSKNQTAQINEVLCKVLAYNITVLIKEMYENNINLNFIDN